MCHHAEILNERMAAVVVQKYIFPSPMAIILMILRKKTSFLRKHGYQDLIKKSCYCDYPQYNLIQAQPF